MAYNVGQFVICIDDSFPWEMYESVGNAPIKGQVYQIRSVKMCTDYVTRKSMLGLRFYELDNDAGNGEPSFSAWRFRELPKKTTKHLKRNTELIFE